MNSLKGKIIIVTGGNGLLGKELIGKINETGGFSINLDINHETTDDLSLIKCDITKTSDVISAIEKIVIKYKKIDCLVNNAYPRTKDWGLKFEDIPIESWKLNVDFQLNSYFFISQTVSKQMLLSNSGSIVNIASIYGVVGPDFNIYEGTSMTMPAAYSAIKGGLISFTKYLASYLGPNNIRVNAVSPGGIFDNQNPIFVNNYNNKVPLRRMGNPDDIIPAIIFLLSEDAKYITGQNLIIDGGFTSI
jgi:NAD(P)-dependent dehydrogenase (short-subunit alcohol dehydrogenase family)